MNARFLIAVVGLAGCLKEPAFEAPIKDNTPVLELNAPFTGLGTTDWGTISAGERYTCGILGDYELACFGSNVGHSTWVSGETAQTLESDVYRISVGLSHTCFVRSDKTAFCWGDNGNNQISSAEQEEFATPAEAMDGDNEGIVDIAALADATCALYDDGEVRCTGTSLTDVATIGVKIDGGDAFVFVQNDEGVLQGFGADENFRLGLDGSPLDFGEATVTSFRVGLEHSCAITEDREAYCWGVNLDAQIALEPSAGEIPNKLVGSNWVKISPGYRHTCGLRDNGDPEIWCWGFNQFHQSGIEENDHVLEETRITESARKRWIEVDAGRTHTCAIDDLHDLYCWGEAPKLGGGAVSATHIPTRVMLSR